MVEILQRGQTPEWKSQPIECELCKSTLQASFADLKDNGDRTQAGVVYWFSCPVCDYRITIELCMAEYKLLRAWRVVKEKQEADERAKNRSNRQRDSCDCAGYVNRSCRLCE